jgi:hypothetical protein
VLGKTGPNASEVAVPDLSPVFSQLRALMLPFGERLSIKQDDATQLYINTLHMQKNKQPLFFGAVQVKKAFVSYHLMPVYVQPGLLDRLSPPLKARMQGKSCFNFKSVEPALFEELAALTAAGFESYQQQGFVD